MTKTEKALAGVKCCLNPVERCDECPYCAEWEKIDHFSFDECRQALKNDVLGTIKDLEKRLRIWMGTKDIYK